MIRPIQPVRLGAALSGCLLAAASLSGVEPRSPAAPELSSATIYRGRGRADWGVSAAPNGGKSVFLENRAFDEFGEIHNGIVCADSDGLTGPRMCDAKPDTTYAVSFFLKGDTAHVELYVAGWSPGGRQALWTSLSERMTPTSEWVRYDGMFKTLPSTRRFAVMLLARGFRERGMQLGTRFYLSDMTVVERPDSVLPTKPPARRAAAPPGQLTCYPVGEWFKVYKDGAAHDGQTWHMEPGSVDRLAWDGWDGRRVRVSGARNDYVDFQLILKADGDVALRAVEVSDLNGPGKAVLPSRQAELFQQWYVDCPRASFPQLAVHGFDEANDGNRAGVAPAHLPPLSHMLEHHYPDGTLPIRNPTSYIPPDLPYQGIWVSVYVPPIDSPAGVYTGTITIRSDASNGTIRLPLELAVEDRCVPLIPYYRAYYPGGDLTHLEEGTPEKGGASPRYAELHLRSRMICSGYGVSYHVNPAWETDPSGDVRLTRFTEDWRLKYVAFGPLVILDDLFGDKGGLAAADAGRRREAALVYRQLIAYCRDQGWWSDDLQQGRYAYAPDGPSYLTLPPGKKPVTVTIQPDEPVTDEQHERIRATCAFFRQEVDPDLLVSTTGHAADKLAAAGTRIAMPDYGHLQETLLFSRPFTEDGRFLADRIWPYDNDAWRVDGAPSRMKKLVLGYPEMAGSFAGNYAWHCTIAQRNALLHHTPTWRSHIPVGPFPQRYGQHACTLIYSGHTVGYKGPVRSMNLQALRNAGEIYDLNRLGAPRFSDATDPVRRFSAAGQGGRVRLTWRCEPSRPDDLKGFHLWGSSPGKWGEGGRVFAGPYNPVFDCERLNRPDLIRPLPSGDYAVTVPAPGTGPFRYILEMIDAANNARYYYVAVEGGS